MSGSAWDYAGNFAVLAVRSTCVLVASAGAVLAQQNPPETARLEEVVVTALKRETALLETPVSLTAVREETLINAGVYDFSAFPRLVPGLAVVDAGPSNRRIAIRGIQGTGEPTTGVYYDETPVGGSVGATNDAGGNTPTLKIFDSERVEVLRGPQGTLYGSGSMGGAVRVVFHKPGFEREGSLEVGATSVASGEPGFLIRGVGNIPIVDERFATRASTFRLKRGGYVDNTVLGEGDIDEEVAEGARLAFRWLPLSTVVLDVTTHYERTRGNKPSWSLESGRYQSDALALPTNEDRLRLYNVTLSWAPADVVVTATISRTDRALDQASADPSRFFAAFIDDPAACARIAGSETCSPEAQQTFNAYVQSFIPSALYPRQETETDTAELRLSSGAERPFTWTVGAFHSARDGNVDNSQLRVDASTGRLSTPFEYHFTRLIDEHLGQAAVFGDGSMRVAERLALTAGIRYFEYDRRVGGQTTIPLDLIGSVATAYASTESAESGKVGKIGLAHQTTPNVLVFAQAAEGFRPGGVNQVLGLPEALAPYQADQLLSYEFGFKGAWAAGRLELGGSVYRIDWDNMQVTGSRSDGLFRFVSNAGAARIDGAEFEVSALPRPSLLLTLAATWNDAQLSEDQRSANVIAAGRAGDRIPYIPKRSASISAEYRRGLPGPWSLLLRLDAYHVGSSYSELRSTSPFYRELRSYSVVNLRSRLSHDDQDWQVDAFVDNTLNELAIAWAASDAVSAGRTMVTAVPPRTIGVTFRKNF